MTETLTDLCKRLEQFETSVWAAEAILRKEILTQRLIDPRCGSGVLSNAATKAGYAPLSINIQVADYLTYHRRLDGDTIFMSPPFSKAVQFVEKAFELGAWKVVCFQRFAWWESKARRQFWQMYPPNRVYVCSDQADCWRHDIPADQQGSSSPTAHAWFVWEQGQLAGTLLSNINKPGD